MIEKRSRERKEEKERGLQRERKRDRERDGIIIQPAEKKQLTVIMAICGRTAVQYCRIMAWRAQ